MRGELSVLEQGFKKRRQWGKVEKAEKRKERNGRSTRPCQGEFEI